MPLGATLTTTSTQVPKDDPTPTVVGDPAVNDATTTATMTNHEETKTRRTTRKGEGGGRPQGSRSWWSPIFPIHWATRFLVKVLIFVVLARLGLDARLWMWDATKTVRFNWDLDNAWENASEAIKLGSKNGDGVGDIDFFGGIVKRYQNSDIDYPPIRMYIKTAWVQFIKECYGNIQRSDWGAPVGLQRNDDHMWPMLAVNYCFELAAALGMYRLCRLYRGRFLSLLAACCLWFNPAVIYNTFGWPQWDCWAIAPLVWAAWAMLRKGKWYSTLPCDVLTGVLLALAAMLKGQSLIVAAWFVLVLVGVTLLNPKPFGCAIRRWWARWPLKPLHLAVRVALIGLAAYGTVWVVVKPFTDRGSTDWTRVYQRETDKTQAMAISGWNVPVILSNRYRWHDAGENWKFEAFGFSYEATLQWWLRSAFGAWVAFIALLSIRARNQPHILLGLAACWAAMFAIVPGMHERYVLWAAAFMAPAVCVNLSATLLYLLVSWLAFANQVYYVLHKDESLMPDLMVFLDRKQTQLDLGWLWLAAAIGITWCVAMARGTFLLAVRRRVRSVVRWRFKQATAA